MALETDAGPRIRHAAITPHDSTELKDAKGGLLYRALYIGGAGNIVIVDLDDVQVTYAVPANFILPFGPKKVMATGTTATGIVGWRN